MCRSRRKPARARSRTPVEIAKLMVAAGLPERCDGPARGPFRGQHKTSDPPGAKRAKLPQPSLRERLYYHYPTAVIHGWREWTLARLDAPGPITPAGDRSLDGTTAPSTNPAAHTASLATFRGDALT